MKQILDSPQLGAFIISFMVEACFIGVLIFAMFHGIQDNQTVQILMGALVASQSQVIQYWIGSTSSSKNKDAVIATQASTAATTSGVPNATIVTPSVTLHS